MEERGNDKLLFSGYRVSVLQKEESSADWLYNNVNVTLLNGALKNGLDGTFCYMYFTIIYH